MAIEEKNAKEEVFDVFDKCTKCGFCKELCPIFLELREEQLSPRAHAILLSNKNFSKLIFNCSLCRLCEEKCPLSLRICQGIKKARFVFNSKQEEENFKLKEMVEKIEEGKNPYL